MACTTRYAKNCMVRRAPGSQVSAACAPALRRSVFLGAWHCTPLFPYVHSDTPSRSPSRAIVLVSVKMIRELLRDEEIARGIRRRGEADAKRDEREGAR